MISTAEPPHEQHLQHHRISDRSNMDHFGLTRQRPQTPWTTYAANTPFPPPLHCESALPHCKPMECVIPAHGQRCFLPLVMLKWLQEVTRFALPSFTSPTLFLPWKRELPRSSLQITIQEHHPTAMKTTPTSVINLPPEITLEIADWLPPDAILSLKLTHRSFNEILHLAPRLKGKSHSECAHLAIRTYLARPVPNPSHLRCIYCKHVYPLSLFKSSSSPACKPTSLTDDYQRTDVVELPQRLCAWHVGRLATIVHTKCGGRNEWISHMDIMCMHCGDIQGRKKCGCKCDSCAYRPVRTYTRYLDNDKECREFVFWREPSSVDVQGRLMVRETCNDSSAPNQKSVINLPVCFDE